MAPDPGHELLTYVAPHARRRPAGQRQGSPNRTPIILTRQSLIADPPRVALSVFGHADNLWPSPRARWRPGRGWLGRSIVLLGARFVKGQWLDDHTSRRDL